MNDLFFKVDFVRILKISASGVRCDEEERLEFVFPQIRIEKSKYFFLLFIFYQFYYFSIITVGMTLLFYLVFIV